MAAIAAIVVGLVGVGLSAYAASENAAAQRRQSLYQRRVAEQQAQQSRDAAQAAADDRERELKRIQAAQRAAIGAAGVTTTEGTSLFVQADTAMESALDVARIKYSGEVQREAFINKAIVAGYQAKSAQRAGTYGVAGTSLLGVSQVASNYSRNTGTTGAGGTTRTDFE